MGYVKFFLFYAELRFVGKDRKHRLSFFVDANFILDYWASPTIHLPNLDALGLDARLNERATVAVCCVSFAFNDNRLIITVCIKTNLDFLLNRKIPDVFALLISQNVRLIDGIIAELFALSGTYVANTPAVLRELRAYPLIACYVCIVMLSSLLEYLQLWLFLNLT